MTEHRMAAIFYVRLPDHAAPPSLEEFATRAGLERIVHEQETVPVLYGQWGVMESVRAVREVLAHHVCLQLFPHASDLLDRIGNQAADSIPIAEAFRGACEALRPGGALLYVRPSEVEPEYILDSEFAELPHGISQRSRQPPGQPRPPAVSRHRRPSLVVATAAVDET